MSNFKFWTVQKKEVLYEILANGIYQPDFSKSWYANQEKDTKDFYDFVLETYCRENEMVLPGIVFSFARFLDIKNGVAIFDCFKSYSDLKMFLREKRDVIKSLWNQIATSDACILELEYDVSKFNPMWIDLNDFQAIMPPLITCPQYDEMCLNAIIYDFSNGCFPCSLFHSKLIQAHLPYIKPENLLNVYPVFNLNDDVIDDDLPF